MYVGGNGMWEFWCGPLPTSVGWQNCLRRSLGATRRGVWGFLLYPQGIWLDQGLECNLSVCFPSPPLLCSPFSLSIVNLSLYLPILLLSLIILHSQPSSCLLYSPFPLSQVYFVRQPPPFVLTPRRLISALGARFSKLPWVIHRKVRKTEGSCRDWVFHQVFKEGQARRSGRELTGERSGRWRAHKKGINCDYWQQWDWRLSCHDAPPPHIFYNFCRRWWRWTVHHFH